jgi:uncharacterized protein DUF4384
MAASLPVTKNRCQREGAASAVRKDICRSPRDWTSSFLCRVGYIPKNYKTEEEDFSMQKWLLILYALLLPTGLAFGQQARDTSTDTKTRDLSNMFYNDTLPPKPEPQTEPKKAPAKKPAPRKPAPSNVSSVERRVGLKYRILLRTPDCDIKEVDSSYTFHSGDKVRLQIESNVDGYLYVLQKGSTGRDHMLFPDPRINGGDNKISRGILYSVPGSQWFTFDNNAGIENLTVAVSRTPMKSIQPPAKSEEPKPKEARPNNQDEGTVSVVSVVEELNQNVRSRDLVLFQEKAPSITAPAQPVAAPAIQSTIVINTSESSNNAVYTEIKLKHN